MIKSNVKKSTKGIASQAGKQLIGEPFEVLKTAGKQIQGESKNIPIQPDEEKFQQDEKKPSEVELKQQSRRLLTALESELEDIKKEKEIEEEKKEQEEMLVKKKEEEEKEAPITEPAAKRSRKFGNLKGMKGKLEKLKRKSEIRMPPSG